jgi:hypothetical protein
MGLHRSVLLLVTKGQVTDTSGPCQLINWGLTALCGWRPGRHLPPLPPSLSTPRSPTLQPVLWGGKGLTQEAERAGMQLGGTALA